MTELAESCHYRARRAAIARANADSPYLKRGLALTPVKFGISFTTSHLNQAGALVLVTIVLLCSILARLATRRLEAMQAQ